MCAHIRQNRHIYPPSIFRLHFDSYPLPLFRRFTVGAAIEKNFFHFSDFVLEFYFFQNPNFNSLSFARYSSSDFSHCIISYWFSLWILIFLFTIFDSDYNFGFYVFRLYISTRFYSLNIPRINFDLFQHCRFYSSTLYLFNSFACYKQTSMLMWVCFMLILSFLMFCDVFSLVLCVVYRLGLK